MNHPAQQAMCLVTGAAGFIGSHLAEALVAHSYRVIGVDAFVDFSPRSMKEANLRDLRQAPTFQCIEADLRTTDLGTLLTGIDYVFHLAAQAGVRTSWGDGFTAYVEHNVLATHACWRQRSRGGSARDLRILFLSVWGNADLARTRRQPPLAHFALWSDETGCGTPLSALYHWA